MWLTLNQNMDIAKFIKGSLMVNEKGYTYFIIKIKNNSSVP